MQFNQKFALTICIIALMISIFIDGSSVLVEEFPNATAIIKAAPSFFYTLCWIYLVLTLTTPANTKRLFSYTTIVFVIYLVYEIEQHLDTEAFNLGNISAIVLGYLLSLIINNWLLEDVPAEEQQTSE